MEEQKTIEQKLKELNEKIEFFQRKETEITEEKIEATRQLTYYNLLLKKLAEKERVVQGSLLSSIEELRALTIHN